MNKLRTKINMSILILFVMLVFVPAKPAEAASVTITFSVEQEQIRVGDEIEVVLLLSSSDTMGDFEAYVSYDETILKPTSKPACITGGAGLLRIADIGASASYTERSYRIRFLALENGECELAIYDRPKVYGYTDGAEMSVTSVNTTLHVFPTINASDNSRLSNLKVADGVSEHLMLTPVFSPEQETYFTAVPYQSERLIISALPEDVKASVAVEGEENLKVGSNEVKITITAENGTKTIYTIYAFREEKKSENLLDLPDLEKEQENLKSEDDTSSTASESDKRESLTIEPLQKRGIRLSEDKDIIVVTEYHRYTACKKPDSLLIPEGYVFTWLFLDGIQLEAYTKQTELSEYLLLTLQNEDGEIAWYCFDRVEQTLQRMNEERFLIQQNPTSTQTQILEQEIQKYQQTHAAMLLGMSILCGVCAVLIIIIVILFLRRKRK